MKKSSEHFLKIHYQITALTQHFPATLKASKSHVIIFNSEKQLECLCLVKSQIMNQGKIPSVVRSPKYSRAIKEESVAEKRTFLYTL